MIRFLEPFTEPPEGLAGAVYRQIESDFGLVPEPFALHRPLPELMAAAWAAFRETVIVQEFLDREAKETIGVAVSRSNRCPYCVDSHGLVLHALGHGATERAVSRGRLQPRRRVRRGPDPALLVFAAWAEATRTDGAASLRELPYTREQAPEAIGAALCFHYINRMVTPLLGATPLPSAIRLLRGPQLRAAARRVAGPARSRHRRGKALELLPDADPPAHLAWAADSPRIQAAFARFSAAVAAAEESLGLDGEARRRLDGRLEGWRGEEMPAGDGWVGEAVSGLEPSPAAGVRLALLAALAPWRIDEKEVAAFRAHHPGDGPLVAALARGSFAAAARISSWLRTAPV